MVLPVVVVTGVVVVWIGIIPRLDLAWLVRSVARWSRHRRGSSGAVGGSRLEVLGCSHVTKGCLIRVDALSAIGTRHVVGVGI